MKRDLIIYCDRVSDAARTLATRLDCRRVRAAGNRARRLANCDGTLVVNYGTSLRDLGVLGGRKSIVLNSPEAVRLSISKVRSYERFKSANVPIVEYTTDFTVAQQWAASGTNVLSRNDGLSSGAGISFSRDKGTVRKADFYSKYFPKTHEYRVHVFRVWPESAGSSSGTVPKVQQSISQGKKLDSYRVIDITQKKLQVDASGHAPGTPGAAGRTLHQRVVRSLENGWVHAHEGLHLPESFREVLSEAAIRAVSSLELDFGAVDIIAQFGTKDNNKLYGYAVLEVNTAPGLGNEVTIEAYRTAISNIYNLTGSDRRVIREPRFRRVRKLVPVTFTSAKGNIITRMRYRLVRERIAD